MLKKTYAKNGNSARVTFDLPREAGGTAVHVCGEWNDWSTDAHPMTRRKDGRFSTTLSLAPGKMYRFKYLVDGARWENDWCADGYVGNPFGTADSMVDV